MITSFKILCIQCINIIHIPLFSMSSSRPTECSHRTANRVLAASSFTYNTYICIYMYILCIHTHTLEPSNHIISFDTINRDIHTHKYIHLYQYLTSFSPSSSSSSCSSSSSSVITVFPF
jgi:hypothetical protein